MEFKDVEVDYCASCGGCWLDQGEWGLIVGGSLDFPARFDFAQGRKGRRPCPHCRKRMTVGAFPGTSVELDFCALHGLWLDKGELQKIIQSRGATAESSALAAYCESVFGKA